MYMPALNSPMGQSVNQGVKSWASDSFYGQLNYPWMWSPDYMYGYLNQIITPEPRFWAPLIQTINAKGTNNNLTHFSLTV